MKSRTKIVKGKMGDQGSTRSRSRCRGIIAVIGPTHSKLKNCIFLMLNTNMKVLFVANKYISRYKHFFVALKSQ